MNTAELRETQAFFASRAPGWEERFPDDEPQYERAVRELSPTSGGRVLDAGCGTGRAIPFLRQAVGQHGEVVALDVTPEMLAEVHRAGRDKLARLVEADGERPPFVGGAFDAVFAAGFVPHLSSAEEGLAELARIVKPGGRLAIFHPIGRATLAARHHSIPSDDDLVAPTRLTTLLAATGWRVERIDDAEDRYLALAVRV